MLQIHPPDFKQPSNGSRHGLQTNYKCDSRTPVDLFGAPHKASMADSDVGKNRTIEQATPTAVS